MQEQPIYQDVVLIGGGHTHTLVLRMWAMNPLPGARLTLVSPQSHTPYSGMLPGLVAGHYQFDETHIDLMRLCRAAGARFIQASAHQVDLARRRVSLAGRPDLEFDLMSLDTGAAPARDIPGAELAVPIKPIGLFYRHWQQLRARVMSSRARLKLGVVGGGAGGCELAMAMAWALEEQLYSGRVEIHLLHAGRKLPDGFPPLARSLLAREMARLNVRVHRDWPVAEITERGVRSERGDTLELDQVLLATEAAAPRWLADSGLALDERGFVQVDDKLRAPGHEFVFAAGDLASFRSRELPKAGVYAVRQAPILFHNLRATLTGRALRNYKPQRDFLRLLSCGNRRALAVRNGIAVTGDILWRWKDHIDRKFMRSFSELPVGMENLRMGIEGVRKWRLPREREQISERGGIELSRMRCSGCGAKVGADVLTRALQQLPQQQSEYLLRGAGDDAAVMALPAGKLLVQSSDQLRALVADPWLFGRLAALHALSDLFAMHAQPASAQALVTLPLAAAEISRRDLQQLLDGAVYELNRHRCALAGGHTAEGAELQLGLTVNGTADAEQLLHKTGARPGDCLILTKPLGVGTLFAAEGLGRADGRWIQQALDCMLISNAEAAEIFAAHRAHALTDVTGFGLLGHLLEMLERRHTAPGRREPGGGTPGGELSATLFAESLPLLPGAAHCAERGWLSSLQPQNAAAYGAIENPGEWQKLPHWALLTDPQTCGGLLAAVPATNGEDCLRALHAAGLTQAAIIGAITQADAERIQQPIRLEVNGDWRQLAKKDLETVS